MSTLDLNGTNITLPDGSVFTTPYLTGANDVTNSGLLDATLTEGGGPTGTTYSGTISDGAHATTAITQTSGEVTFTSSNTYSGGTFLEDGWYGLVLADNEAANGTMRYIGALARDAGLVLMAAGLGYDVYQGVRTGDFSSLLSDAVLGGAFAVGGGVGGGLGTALLYNGNALVDQQLAAAETGLSPRTFEAWRLKGQGPPYIKLGKSVRYRRADLIEWLRKNTLSSTSKGTVS